MRSTAFTSRPALLPAPAAARPFEGCSAGRHDAARLATQPARVVSRIGGGEGFDLLERPGESVTCRPRRAPPEARG